MSEYATGKTGTVGGGREMNNQNSAKATSASSGPDYSRVGGKSAASIRRRGK